MPTVQFPPEALPATQVFLPQSPTFTSDWWTKNRISSSEPNSVSSPPSSPGLPTLGILTCPFAPTEYKLVCGPSFLPIPTDATRDQYIYQIQSPTTKRDRSRCAPFRFPAIFLTVFRTNAWCHPPLTLCAFPMCSNSRGVLKGHLKLKPYF